MIGLGLILSLKILRWFLLLPSKDWNHDHQILVLEAILIFVGLRVW
jgi:hypothetical protein